MELVRFDMQAMENPDIEGCQYQQGQLSGYELKEYLLEKWGRTCAYCNKQNIPLQIEHIIPRAKGGTDRVSNLTLACEKCNVAKGTQDIKEFLKKKPDVLKRLLTQARTPLKDAAAVNTTRWALYERLKERGLPIECGSGGLTKFNRRLRRLPKAHWLDAANVGRSTPPLLQVQGITPLLITATGYGNRQMCNVNDLGFPCSRPKGAKRVKGLQTGDMVRAAVTTGTKRGVYMGRVLIRASGSFDITPVLAVSKGFIIAFALRCRGWMAMVMRKEQSLQTPPPNPPNKERPFLPWLKTQGLPGPTLVSEVQESLEWLSVVTATVNVDVRSSLPTLDAAGVIAYTDGACIKNPGGPGGWSALLWSAHDVIGDTIPANAPCLECYGHIPKASTTTNNRAEISAVLAVLSIAPPTLPLTIYSDSEYTIKVATGVFQMKANADLWAIYRQLLGYRKHKPEFIWVRGHAGQQHNERADELAGLGAFNGDHAAFEKWQASQAPAARNAPLPAHLGELRQQVDKLKMYVDASAIDSPRVSPQERQFINDMAKRLQKNNFAPTDKQSGWVKGLVTKYRL